MAVTLVTKKAGQATVTKDHKKQGQTIAQELAQEEVGEPKVLEGPTCNVGVDASFTKNMGNYESLRLGVSIHLPCYHHEIDEVFDFGKEWVNAKMETLLAELEAGE
jgi:hypothetical protein